MTMFNVNHFIDNSRKNNTKFIKDAMKLINTIGVLHSIVSYDFINQLELLGLYKTTVKHRTNMYVKQLGFIYDKLYKDLDIGNEKRLTNAQRYHNDVVQNITNEIEKQFNKTEIDIRDLFIIIHNLLYIIEHLYKKLSVNYDFDMVKPLFNKSFLNELQPLIKVKTVSNMFGFLNNILSKDYDI